MRPPHTAPTSFVVCVLDTMPLFAALAAIPLATAPAAYQPRDLAVLLLSYYLLALMFTWQALIMARVWPRVWWLSGMPAALALTWQLREHERWPERGPAIVAVSAALCLFFSWLARRRSRVAETRRALAFALGAAAAFVALLVPAFHAWNDFRWHVLQHNVLLGMPLYYADSTPTAEVVKLAWSTRGTGAPVRPPDFAEGPQQGPAPDILFILLDTLRADRLVAYGGPPQLAPNMNALAARSTVFTDVQANASWTRPSIASMFTGLLQEQHGAVDRSDALPESVTTLAEHLSMRGYRTVGFVTNFGAVGVAAGFAQGFDELIELSVSDGPYMQAAEVNRRVHAWLQAAPRDAAPTFLYVHYLDPHDPWLASPPKSNRYADLMAAYDADVRYFDAQLPDLLASVRAARGREPAIVLVSDHGEEFGEHGASGHGSALSREQLHIPLMVSVPGAQPAVSSARLEGRDVFTLVGFLAQGGRDLPHWAVQKARDGRYASVYLTTPMSPLKPRYRQVGMQAYDDGAHLVRWSAFGETHELYDLARDPDVRANTFELKPHVAAELVPQLRAPIRHAIEAKTAPQRDDRALHALRALGYVD